MTVDIKCPHCNKDTDYNLNYGEDYCEHCNKEITYKEMYSGTSGGQVLNWNGEYKVYVETDNDYNEYEFNSLEEAENFYNSIDETSGIILPDGSII